MFKIPVKNMFIKHFSWLCEQKHVQKFIIYKHKHTFATQGSTSYHYFSSLELYTHTNTLLIKHNSKQLQNTKGNILRSFHSMNISLLVTAAVWMSLLSVENFNDKIYLLGEYRKQFIWSSKLTGKKQQHHFHWARIYFKENKNT